VDGIDYMNNYTAEYYNKIENNSRDSRKLKIIDTNDKQIVDNTPITKPDIIGTRETDYTATFSITNTNTNEQHNL
jgi:hypothetical protein